MLHIKSGTVYGYIETPEELERIAELLQTKLTPLSTYPEGVVDGFFLHNSTNGEHTVTTYFIVGSYISITALGEDTCRVQRVAQATTPPLDN